ncbi:MAG: response regulator [Elusimicrobia bacterium]|nr:response regulator [Elusimicrobiota bacterium]
MLEENPQEHASLAASRLKGILQKLATFVCVDVVDSTGMKVDEAEEDVIFSFLAYQKMVEDAFGRHGGQLVSISGDGIMARFSNGQDAILYATDLLDSLARLNANIQLLKIPFKIRIGVNTGQIYFDSSKQMATLQILPSSTIDLAGYLQKYAPANTAWISQSTVEQMERSVPGVRKDHLDKKFGFTIYSYSGAEDASKPPPKRSSKKKILIIEDEPGQAYVLAQGFQAAGYETEIAFDGEEGLLHLKIFRPDVIVLDIGLPRMNGWQVLHEIKANKMAPGVSVMMLARRYRMEDIERSFAMGASGCVRKPCELRHLMRKIEIVLND